MIYIGPEQLGNESNVESAVDSGYVAGRTNERQYY